MNRENRQMRTASTQFATRDDNGALAIEGYFAVFNSNYDIAPGLSESIAPGAFDNTLSGDIRALINHDTTLVLGRTKANTLQLRTDNHGLWGHIDINPNDTDAMNLYNRVQRGDVDQIVQQADQRVKERPYTGQKDQNLFLYQRFHGVTCCFCGLWEKEPFAPPGLSGAPACYIIRARRRRT